MEGSHHHRRQADPPAAAAPTSTARRCKKKELDWTVFRNPSLYSFFSPGFLIVLSILLDASALVTASFVWCFDREFRDFVLEFKERNLTRMVPEGGWWMVEDMVEEIAEGCLHPMHQSFDEIEGSLHNAIILAGLIGMDPLSRGVDDDFKHENHRIFEEKSQGRNVYLIGWFHYTITTSISILLGVTFFVLQLWVSAGKHRKWLTAISLPRNLIALSGIIHYTVGYAGLSSIDTMQLNYLFQDSTLFILGITFSCFGLLADISGSGLTANHCKKATDGKSQHENEKIEILQPQQGRKERMLNQNVSAAGGETADPRNKSNQIKSNPFERSRLVTAEEASVVDWKRFHRIVSPRDDRGRRRYVYALPFGKATAEGKTKYWLTEEEAKGIDWKDFHRVRPFRGNGDNGLYKIPDKTKIERMAKNAKMGLARRV